MSIHLKSNRFWIAVMAVMILTAGFVQADSMLERMVAEGGAEWIAGRWVAQTDEGETAVLTYQWKLDKQMIAVSFKMNDYAYEGMIYCSPYDETVIEVGIDSKGGVTNSQWDGDYYGLVSNRQTRQVDGQLQDMVMVSSETGKDTMKMELYGQDYGSMSASPWATLNFKRQPLEPQKVKAIR